MSTEKNEEWLPLYVKTVSEVDWARARRLGRRIKCTSENGQLEAYEYQGSVYVIGWSSKRKP